MIVFFGCSEERAIKIGLQPFSTFDDALTDTVSNVLKKSYGVEVRVLKSQRMPHEAFVKIKSPRYRADKLISILKEQKSDSLDYIVGLTTEDISFTKTEAGKVKEPVSRYEDWGIFGLGYRPGPTSVVSTFRINDKGRAVIIDRLKKIAVHEVGHNMGLEHCKSEKCVMKDAAESIKTIDGVNLHLCDECRTRLK